MGGEKVRICGGGVRDEERVSKGKLGNLSRSWHLFKSFCVWGRRALGAMEPNVRGLNISGSL
jgi:hypothetical protein